jgi:hypothetical protein
MKSERDREDHKAPNISISCPLAAIGHSKDRPVSVDQSLQQIHHCRDGVILK